MKTALLRAIAAHDARVAECGHVSGWDPRDPTSGDRCEAPATRNGRCEDHQPDEDEARASLPQALADVERDLIRDALQEAGGNRSKAAKILGITRPKLYRRMAALFTPEQLAAMAVDSPRAPVTARQELHWVGPDRNVSAVTSQPSRVWCLPGDQSRAYAVPFAPIHGFNAWSLDVGHDWAMRGPKRCLRYSPGGGDHKGAWLLCEWEEKTEKK